jgi:signal transduction histidine kinase
MVKKPFDIVKVVDTIVKDQQMKAQGKGIILTSEHSKDSLTLNGDEGQLFQVIDNLIDNAMKFTPEKGNVKVTVEEAKGGIRVGVADTGPGIDEKMISKLFESFHRGADPLSVDNKGSGLGLYFVKLAVEAHGGEVAISSQVGKGTEVSFQIPQKAA